MHYPGIRTSHCRTGGQDRRAEKLAEDDPEHGNRGRCGALHSRAGQMVRETYSRLTPWQKVQVARHPGRPHFLDYARLIFDEFHAAGRRPRFRRGPGDCRRAGALSRPSGGRFSARRSGNDTQSRLKHNFGMAMPEGYRKAVRLFELAGRFGLPVLSFCRHLGRLSRCHRRGTRPGGSYRPFDRCRAVAKAPFIATIIGEGGVGRRHRHRRRQSGLYAGTCDLFSDLAGGRGFDPVAHADKAQEAAAALKITAQDLLDLKID